MGRNIFNLHLKQRYMGSQKIDPVLLIVGLILILAVVLWAGAMLFFPADTTQKTQNWHQYSSTGKAFGEKNCCTEKYPDTPGCKRVSERECQKRCGEERFSCRQYGREIIITR
jgi:hypothetical protein